MRRFASPEPWRYPKTGEWVLKGLDFLRAISSEVPLYCRVLTELDFSWSAGVVQDTVAVSFVRCNYARSNTSSSTMRNNSGSKPVTMEPTPSRG